jgi:hypothetical protein
LAFFPAALACPPFFVVSRAAVDVLPGFLTAGFVLAGAFFATVFAGAFFLVVVLSCALAGAK